MELLKQKFKCKCDLNNCKNDADYCVTADGVLPTRRFNICESCALKLSALIRKQTADKRSVKSEEKS